MLCSRRIFSAICLIWSGLVGSGQAAAAQFDCVTINADTDWMQRAQSEGYYRHPLESELKRFDFAKQSAASYQDYLAHTRRYLAEVNPRADWACPLNSPLREALAEQYGWQHPPKVLDFVAPYELKSADDNKLALLVHGLTDSPFSYHDMAFDLWSQGYTVRTLLIPGHGEAPAAMLGVRVGDWRAAVDYALEQAVADYSHVVLGGYSTGATLLVETLMDHADSLPEQLKGVMLWSPAVQSTNRFAWISPWVNPLFTPTRLKQWLEQDADTDVAKYESFTLKEAAEVEKLMRSLRGRLSRGQHGADLPMFVALSEVDETTVVGEGIAMLESWHNTPGRTTAQRDKLFLVAPEGQVSTVENGLTTVLSSCPSEDQAHACHRVVGASHALVLSPENPLYGEQGAYRNCGHYLGDWPRYQACKSTTPIVFAEKTEQNLQRYQPMARLMFNPYYQQQWQALEQFLDSLSN
ncbi:alpha/beta hydrolase [Aliagarivorans taiwanensis]|uniref:alpha/beta hydrolase n=1 Tax=Aliagarivorans taiwanensis TaxID=561966 RepID=UPI00146FB87C|nr:alpha/beta fold hydrolase [Aliagarivorans taiwanensis]